ncbi:hypothetical protein ABZY03_19875 [Streptomyces klenkii]|uniref:hypothetical protein n=1 Tax=Streptomyces klenkii TaxID=1420899 RepID=UPI0033B97DFA
MRIRTRHALGAAASAVVLAGTLGAGVARAGDPEPPPLPPLPVLPTSTEVSPTQCFGGGGTVGMTLGDDFDLVLVCQGGTYNGLPIG